MKFLDLLALAAVGGFVLAFCTLAGPIALILTGGRS